MLRCVEEVRLVRARGVSRLRRASRVHATDPWGYCKTEPWQGIRETSALRLKFSESDNTAISLGGVLQPHSHTEIVTPTCMYPL